MITLLRLQNAKPVEDRIPLAEYARFLWLDNRVPEDVPAGLLILRSYLQLCDRVE